MAENTDVLVIGAGPIGLINAWGIQRLNPSLNVVVLEKYEEYQRKHTLVMQPKHLEAIMKATHSEDHPTLVDLLKQLKKDPHIRTSVLQEIFTKLALASNVQIKTKSEVFKEKMNETINAYPNVSLIIGADGTHSVVSDSLFPDGNQVKYEFDFVLQLRFEIKGEEKAPGIKTLKFYQLMARKGLIANEYNGSFEKGKTPVTMQMMISKADFMALQKATSKNPLRPFATPKADQKPPEVELPSHLQSFITRYIRDKITDTVAAGQELDRESITISVNEAPATHAKHVVNKRGDTFVVLKGDSALGLSYFKGLNAGLEASAKFLSSIGSSIKNSFRDKETLAKQLDTYQSWFLNDFSPKKVKEVGQYSFWQIRSFMRAMEAVQFSKETSMADEDDDLEPIITNYFKHYTTDPLARLSTSQFRPFPHRDYEPVKLAQLEYIPLKHTAKKIMKTFVDYFKPYKSDQQIVQDFKQPIVGLANVLLGIAKIAGGVFGLNLWSFVDGVFNVLRGAIEIATTPLTWLLKPLTRGIATLIHGGYKNIEENRGLHRLAQDGIHQLNHTNDRDLYNDQSIYKLLAFCNDIHRKFDKSVSRNQATALGADEYGCYSEILTDKVLSREKVHRYFSLFAPQQKQVETTQPERVLRNVGG